MNLNRSHGFFFLFAIALLAIFVAQSLPGPTILAQPPSHEPVRPPVTPGERVVAPDGRVKASVDTTLWMAAPAAPELTANAAMTQTLLSVADADVYSNFPDVNLGADPEIWAGYDDYSETNLGIVRALVLFDLSGLPANAQIDGATLRLFYASSWGFEGQQLTITTHKITGGWTEMGVTWNTQPGYTSSYGQAGIEHSVWGWYDFDVTALVQEWQGGTAPNYGIMVRGPETPQTGWRGFAAREYVAYEPDTEPQLVISYTVPEPTNTATATNTPVNTATATNTPVNTATATNTPVNTATATATATNTATPTPGTCQELLLNGSFEQVLGWVFPTTTYTAGYTTAQAHTGSRSARTGILLATDNRYSYSTARQQVVIPVGMTNVKLRFWLYPLSTEAVTLSLPGANALSIREVESANSGDAQLVSILNQYGQEVERLLTTRRNDGRWLYYEFDLSHRAGQTIQVYFSTYNNGWSGVTAMYVDDVSLGSCDPLPPTPTATPTTVPPTATPTPVAPQSYLFYGPTIFNDRPVGISGRVVDTGGLPLAGVTVATNDGRSMVTGVDGLYSFVDLPAGTYTVTPAKAGYTFEPPSATVSVPPSAGYVNFVGELPAYP